VDVMVAEHGISVRQACRAARLARSAYYAPAAVRNDGPEIAAIQAYIAQNEQHGFDKLYPVVRRQGFGKCRLYRVYKALRLNIKRRGKKRLPARIRTPLRSCTRRRRRVGNHSIRISSPILGEAGMKLSVFNKPRTRVISSRALMKRINRTLRQNDEVLRKVRSGSSMEWGYGPYYTLNWRHNYICDKGLYIEDLGRDLGVLRDGERLKVEG